MAKKKTKNVKIKTQNGEENFRFALNAAVLAVLVGVLIMLVSQMGVTQRTLTKAAYEAGQSELGR